MRADNPEFKAQIDKLQQQTNALTTSPAFVLQMKQLDSPEFKAQMEKLEQQTRLLALNNSTLRLQLESLQNRPADARFRQRVAAARQQLHDFAASAGDADRIQQAVNRFVAEMQAASQDLARDASGTPSTKP